MCRANVVLVVCRVFSLCRYLCRFGFIICHHYEFNPTLLPYHNFNSPKYYVISSPSAATAAIVVGYVFLLSRLLLHLKNGLLLSFAYTVMCFVRGYKFNDGARGRKKQPCACHYFSAFLTSE